MKPHAATCSLALLWMASVTPAMAQAPAAAIRTAVAEVESRVVQLRYFGSAQTIGGAAAPVSGYDLGDGWAITSLYGLAAPPAAVLLIDAAGQQHEATVVGRDLSRQLAVVKTANAAPACPPLEGRAARVGETAIALGRPDQQSECRITVGLISAVGRFGGRAVQTDALISPSNYGGPLIGLDGVLLGVIAPLSPPGQSGVNLYDSGIGFAVPASQIDPRLEQLAGGDDIRPGWLGASFAKEDPLRAPARLHEVAPDGPAARAGLVAEDVITAVAGVRTPSLRALRSRLRAADAGQAVELAVERGGETRGVAVTLTRRPDPPAPPIVAEDATKPDEP